MYALTSNQLCVVIFFSWNMGILKKKLSPEPDIADQTTKNLLYSTQNNQCL